MSKVYGIDLGTTYSCIAYLDEGMDKPEVVKNAEGALTTPSVVQFESPTDVHVGDMAKENAKMYPDQVVSFIKRSIGQAGFKLTINGVDYTPEDVSSYILKKVTGDAKDSLDQEGKIADGEEVKDVVITCPAYFGVEERDATAAAGKIAGLNVLGIINEPTAAAISYGVTADSSEKTVMVYDLGGGTFDITMIHIKAGEIRVICTGGDKDLGGKDWDDRVIQYLAEQFQQETGTPDNILEDPETYQDVSLSAERAKKLLSAKPKAPVSISYQGERARVELTREKFDELTADLLTRTIDLTKEMLKEAEKKGFKQSDVSEILLVGGSSKMPQVQNRVRAEFGIETKMFDPDEAVAKGAAIYARNMKAYNILIEDIAKNQGKTFEQLKDDIDTGKTTIEQEAQNANISLTQGSDSTGAAGGAISLKPIKIINVTSRSFGIISFNEEEKLVLYNLLLKNAELPTENTQTFYPHEDNQTSVSLEVMEDLSSDEQTDKEQGKPVGTALLKLPAGATRATELSITFRLDESGLLHVRGEVVKTHELVEADFETKSAMSQEELDAAAKRNQSSSVD